MDGAGRKSIDKLKIVVMLTNATEAKQIAISRILETINKCDQRYISDYCREGMAPKTLLDVFTSTNRNQQIQKIMSMERIDTRTARRSLFIWRLTN